MSNFDLRSFHEALESMWLGRSIDARLHVTSTMDVAFEGASQVPHGHLVVADEQSAARGSRGRSWRGESQLTISFVLHVDLPPAACPPLTLAAGLGVADCVSEFVDGEVRIKWPNDVLVSDQKIAGILSEIRGPNIVVGIGLNLVETPELRRLEATSLEAQGVRPAREIVLAQLCRDLEGRLDTHLRLGAHATTAALNTRLAWAREEVVCGEQAGRLEGVAPDGRLCIHNGETSVKVSSGTLRRAPQNSGS